MVSIYNVVFWECSKGHSWPKRTNSEFGFPDPQKTSKGPQIEQMTLKSPRHKRSPAKGVWPKSDEESDRSIRKSDQKVTERVPKTKKVIKLLLPTSLCGTLIKDDFKTGEEPPKVSNPPTPHSIQKGRKPQICPEFVSAIVCEGSTQSDWDFCPKINLFLLV